MDFDPTNIEDIAESIADSLDAASTDFRLAESSGDILILDVEDDETGQLKQVRVRISFV